MDNSITFYINGKPRPQQRHKTSFKNGRMWNYDPSKKEKAQFSIIAKTYAPKYPLNGPITMEVVCAFPRPKSHYGTGKNEGKLKEKAAPDFFQKPDLDNCLKFVMDALQINSIWYKDDCIINKATIDKIWADDCEPGTYVKIIKKEDE
tara:strand:- start:80 stop:523 length:444 start_codon:yes stop_codon:yes gene_type:complete